MRRPDVLRCVCGLLLVLAMPRTSAAQSEVAHSVEQLRHVIGRWSVVTEFLNPDGSVAAAPRGTYEFDWVVPDRVVRGLSEIPERKQKSALLFYVSESRKIIEMSSVGADGQLYVMTGPLGGETRVTQVFAAPRGGDMQLRFTRYNLTPDRFESKMALTTDGGRTWTPGNHQVFERLPRAALPATDIAGPWQFVLQTDNGPREIPAVFKLDGTAVSGTFDTAPVSGTWKDGTLDLSFTYTSTEGGMTATVAIKGKLEADALTGHWTFAEYGGAFKATPRK